MPYDAPQGQAAPSDTAGDPAKEAARWIAALDLAEKNRKRWLELCKRIIAIYASNKLDVSLDKTSESRKFALLWSNMETLTPATFARTPTAVVSRRWKDADPTGRVASEVLERALNFALDACDFEGVLKGVTRDFLLLAKGVPWVRYVPHIQTLEADGEKETGVAEGQIAEEGEVTEDLAWEEAIPDHVAYKDFLHNVARMWTEVTWVARCAFLTRDECKARFTAKAPDGRTIGECMPLDHKVDDTEEAEQFAKAAVWEIWDKTTRKVFWVSKGYSSTVLDQRDDPLGLQDFFPCPRPAIGTTGPDSLTPTPDYDYYRSQDNDINELTARIGLLTDALRLRGFYAAGGEQKDKLNDLLTSATNTLIPIDNYTAFQQGGGIGKLIEWMPIDMIVATLQSCIEARKQLIEDVYQITGIADIMRGDVDPDETATATRKKETWGSSRVRDKQQTLSRVARETVMIMGQIIASKFSPKTLAAMSNIQLLPDQQAKDALQQQLAVAQQRAQQTQQPPPQVPAQIQKMLADPTWEEVTGLLRDKVLRTFRLDIETDSTIQPDDQDEKQRAIEFVEAIGKLMGEIIPMMQVAPQLLPIGTEAVKFLTRKFRVGREMEDVIEKAMDALQQAASQGQGQQPAGHAGPNPQAEQMKAQASMTVAQAKTMDAQTNQFRAQTDRAEAQAGASLEQQRIQHEAQQSNMDRSVDLHTQAEDRKAEFIQSIVKAVERHSAHEMVNPQPIKAPTP